MNRLYYLIFIWLFLGCLRDASRAESPPSTKNGLSPRPGMIQVETSLVTEQTIPTFEEVTGTTIAQMKTMIAAKISGRVEKILVSPGSVVKAGDLLIEIEAADIKARLEQAVAVARQAELDLKRLSKLLTQKATAQQDYDIALTHSTVAQAAVAEAQTMLGYSRITAPFDGVVSNKLVDIGTLAVPGSPLLEIMTSSSMRFEAEIPASLISHLSIGKELEVKIGSISTPVLAKVSEIIPAADPNSRTVLIKADLPNMPGIVPGVFGRISVPTGSRTLLQVPAISLIKRGQLEIIFVIERERAVLRLVKTRSIDGQGAGKGSWIEILSGVSPGERVASSKLAELRDGCSVVVVSPQSIK